MGIGSGSSSSSFSGLPVMLAAVALIAGLAIGFVAAGYVAANYSGGGGSVIVNNDNFLVGSSGQKVFTSLSNEDKNFLVQMANAQVDLTTRLTAQQSASVDWCTALGGKWLTSQNQSEQPVSAQDAQLIQQSGGKVTQNQDGTFTATVVLLDRSSCAVLPTTQAGAAGG